MTKSVLWSSCARLSCQNLQSPGVVICLTSSDLVNPVPCVRSTIDGILTKSWKDCDGCNNTTYRYLIAYDEAQLADPTTALTTAEITGVFCKGCLTDWIQDEVFCASGAAVCVADTVTLDLSINDSGCIQGNVNVSQDQNNILSISSDGLFVPTPGGGGAGWLLLGNAGTVDGTNFLGTTDNVAFDVRVNNVRAIRVIPPDLIDGGYPDLILGDPTNIINGVTSGFGSSILGGDSNTITGGQNDVIAGGHQNLIDGTNTTFSIAAYSTISGGQDNSITYTTNVGDNNTIGGGISNWIEDGESSTICGGAGNKISGVFSTILGGEQLHLGANSVGFQGNRGNFVGVDLSAFGAIGYFGEVDIWIANSDNTARKLKFFEPNSDRTFAATNYSSFEAGTQNANWEYILPVLNTGAPTPGQNLQVQSVSGQRITLTWA